MNLDNLRSHLPDGVEAKIVTYEGKQRVNVKGDGWQTALDILEDDVAAEEYIIVQAERHQVLHEHQLRIRATNRQYKQELRLLDERHISERNERIKIVKEKYKVTKAEKEKSA